MNIFARTILTVGCAINNWRCRKDEPTEASDGPEFCDGPTADGFIDGDSRMPSPAGTQVPVELGPDHAAIMFIVFNVTLMLREAAFGSYDDAMEYLRDLDNADECLVETVEEDEDLFHTINS